MHLHLHLEAGDILAKLWLVPQQASVCCEQQAHVARDVVGVEDLPCQRVGLHHDAVGLVLVGVGPLDLQEERSHH